MEITAWVVRAPGEPIAPERRTVAPGPGEVLVEVAGCGVCHTDLGFYYDGVPTRRGFPLALGHEVSGVVVEAGEGAGEWVGRAVVVPAVIPCGRCDACRAGRASICPGQVFPGSDVDGGFASHVVVPARGLCPVPDLADPARNPGGLALWELSVVADAVTTPYEAACRAELGAGDLALFIGAGGIGGFGVQVAAALGATVIAVEPDPARREMAAAHGADLALDAATPFRDLKQAVRAFAAERGIPSFRWKIFETSGTPAGQATAFGLLGPGGYLGVVGFTPKKLELRLSNLMAFDATARGNWGCPPERYPGALDLVLSGQVALRPAIERRPLASINETFADVHAGRVQRRVVLVPEERP